MHNHRTTWLREVPDDWRITTIGSLYTLRNEKVSDKDYPPLSVTMKGIVPQLESAAKTDDGDNRKLVKVGDFVINSRSDRRGSCGISAYDGSVSLINTILTPREAMHPGYYNWLFHTAAFADEFYKWGHGIVDDLWTTRWQEMKHIVVPVPSMEEQQAIAAYLDEQCALIDEAIAAAKNSIEEYKAWKVSIIFNAVTKGLDKKVEFKESGIDWLGCIPSLWGCGKIKHFASLSSGGTPKSDHREYYDGDINWACSLDLSENELFETQNHLSEIGLKNCASAIQPVGTIVMAMYGGSGTIGNSAILCVSSATNQALCCMKFDERILDKYAFYYIRAIRKYWMIYAVGTRKDPNISQAIVGAMPMLLPSMQEQIIIVDYLDYKLPLIESIISQKEAAIADLESYKRSLIYEAVTGKRKVE